MSINKIVECVPNFSEGRNPESIEKIVNCFRNKTDVKLLDYSADADHNRMVVTVVGEPMPLAEAVLDAIGVAKDIIDLTKHSGQHPRMGATDVVPFIPIRNVTKEEAIELSKFVGEQMWSRYGIPVFLYEKSATNPDRENLANIRKGQFEGMAEKMKKPEWKADYGNDAPHPTAGVTAVGMRMPLVAFNVNLDTDNLDIATKIGKRVRFIGGGLRFVKAMGVELKDRHIVQVSMNLTDYTQTPIYMAVEMVKVEARRYGVNVIGTEVIGLVPMQALVDCAEYYLQIEEFKPSQVLESNL
ncbi:MAG TPA: glutamate formimidoyltransferase [Clostridia bacterium]|nr:glutamate formimidoyltransferase [Clostridia bacterium]